MGRVSDGRFELLTYQLPTVKFEVTVAMMFVRGELGFDSGAGV